MHPELVRTEAVAHAVHVEREDAARTAAAFAERGPTHAGGAALAGRGLSFPPCPKCQGISFYV